MRGYSVGLILKRQSYIGAKNAKSGSKRNMILKKKKVHKCNLHEASKTTHSTGKDDRYEAATWYAINHTFAMGMQLIGRGGRESTKLLGMMNLPYQG